MNKRRKEINRKIEREIKKYRYCHLCRCAKFNIYN